MKKHLIVDSSYLMYRSHFAYPNLIAAGKPAGAFFGFVKTLMAVIREFNPDKIYFALDSKQKTWRHKEYPEYKAGRAKMEDDMREQIPVIIKWIQSISPECVEFPGFEADDLINTYVYNQIEQGSVNDEFIIFSSDQDLYQMFVMPGVGFVRTTKGVKGFQLLKLEDFMEKHHLNPIQWVDYKALVGDPSDNLKGVAGIGPKTAQKLLTQGGDLKNILDFLDLDSSSFQETGLELNKDFFEDKKQSKVLERIKNDYKHVVSTYKLARLSLVKKAKLDNISFNFENGFKVSDEYNFRSIRKEWDNFVNPPLQEESLF